jgi:hypothetical protein
MRYKHPQNPRIAPNCQARTKDWRNGGAARTKLVRPRKIGARSISSAMMTMMLLLLLILLLIRVIREMHRITLDLSRFTNIDVEYSPAA